MKDDIKDLTLGDCYSAFIDDGRKKKDRAKRMNIFNNQSFDAIKKVHLKNIHDEDAKSHLSVELSMLLKSLRYSKSSGYKVLQEFFTFLRYRFKVDASINDYIQEPKREGIDRLLDILKVLQGSGMRRCDLCERYNIEDDTLRSDLNQLETGISIMGQQLQAKMKEEKGQITFDSSVHPVFLPMNLTEAFALTVGLKMMKGGPQHRKILNHIADWVYSQLSDYAKDRINRSININQYDIGFQAGPGSFTDEQDLLGKPYFDATYHEKRATQVIVEYNDHDVTQKITGRVRTSRKGEHIEIIRSDDSSVSIPLEDINSIEEVGQKRAASGPPAIRRAGNRDMI
jgi:hypothetical protein